MEKELIVRPIRGEERETWDQLMAAHHYLGLKHLVGESIRYVALLNGQWVALLGWTSAAYKSGPRDKWIGWDEDTRHKRLKFLANNARFLILPEVRVKNLASQILAANLKRLPGDWVKVYDHPVWLTETFIDHARFAGTCYRAAGFLPLGQTRGFRRNAGYYYEHGAAKTILVRPLHQQARQWLTAPFLSPALLMGKNPLADLNQLSVEELLTRLKEVAIPRMPRGVRHQSSVVLTVIVCAVLSGAESFLGLGRWAANLPQNTLRRLGAQRSPKQRRFVPPNEITFRRALRVVDMPSFCRAVAGWLDSQGLKSVTPSVLERLRSLRERTHR